MFSRLVAVAMAAALTVGIAPGTTFDPRSLPIPAMCRHAASRLHDGVKDFGATRGDASLMDPAHPIVAIQRSRAASVAYAAVPIRCSAGGVDWPQTIVLYTRGGRILAATDLEAIAQQEHTTVTSVSLTGDRIAAAWTAFDGADFHVHHQSATFTLRHGTLVASHVRRYL